MEIINKLFLDLLTYFATIFGGSLGFAIIALTIVIRSALVPFTIPSLKSQKKLRDLKPELDKLKSKFGHDQKLHSEKQLEFYKQNNINPVAGCLPQLVQLGILIILYQFLVKTLGSENSNFTLSFYHLTLSKPDSTYLLPILAGITQFILGLMLLPATSTKAEHELASKTKTKKDDKEADNMTDMAATMQTQMIFVMPFMTALFALNFPSGLGLYWVVTTVFSIVQQYLISGPGGLTTYTQKLFPNRK